MFVGRFLGGATVAHPLGDEAALKLGNATDDLSHEDTHRVIGIILKDFATIGSEHGGTDSPGNLQDRLLHM